MHIEIPAAVIDILEKINAAGFEAYIVGGCVRDYLLGKEPADWDITTSAMPLDIKKIFTKTVDTGIKHGTVTVIKGHVGYEVTTYRIDGEYEDGRHPKQVIFTPSLEEDLKRRDFTINAMAYNPSKGLVDIFGGQEDLRKGIIRAVGNPIERFTEDALRMMRAIRFSAQLGYDIEKDTFSSIIELSQNITKISAERIQVEMVKLLTSDNPYRFKLFYEAGLTKHFFPEFDEAMNTKQNHPHHMYSVGEHILHSLEYVRPVKHLRLAMLFHDIAKPKMLTIDSEAITHFHGHPAESAKMAKDILRRLKFDNATIDKVCDLAMYHDRRIEYTRKAMRRALNTIGGDNFPDLFEVKYADTMAQSMYMRSEKLEDIENMKKVYEEIVEQGEAFTIKDLAVTGKDLMDEGVPQGKQIGVILSKMLDDVIDEPEHNDKTYLIKTYVKTAITQICLIVCILLGCISLTACSMSSNKEEKEASPDTGFVPATPGNYDSVDRAVITDINKENMTITFQTTYIGKKYTLSYDGATVFTDKYGYGLSVDQLRRGDYVIDSFMKSRKRLDNLMLVPEEFEFTNTNEFEIMPDGRSMLLGSDKYTFDKNLVVITSQGTGQIFDINSVDKLTVIGQDKVIYSIIVESGHGYLKLSNDEFFYDGWLEINKNIVKKIEEDMIVPVPVGTYNVTVSNQGCQGTESVTIVENEEYTLDVAKYAGEAKYGKILFALSPSDAKVYIDGNVTDVSTAVELQYGIHQMIVICDGYQTISRYIKVGSPSASLDVTMESKDGSTVSDNSVSDNQIPYQTPTSAVVTPVSNNEVSASPAVIPSASPIVTPSISPSPSARPEDVISTTGEHKVSIDSPEKVEVYVDGSYIGISPVSFAKKEGQVVVTLRKDGYQTRSYTLSIDNSKRDENYSFSALIPIP